jgi:HEAT repeat protein
LPATFSAARFAAHSDGRVRREALRLQFRLPAERDQALVAALGDDDPRALQFALHAARQGCPAAAVPVVIARAQDRALDSDVRALAIRVLGSTRAPQALVPLLELVDGGTSFFGRRKLRPKSPEMLAALAALAAGWSGDRRVGPLLSSAGRSDDPDIRATVGGARPKR